MKAPDKICIRKDDTAPFGFTRHWIYTTKVQEHDIEYIRKDVLNNWLQEHINDYLVHGRDIDLMFDDIKNAF